MTDKEFQQHLDKLEHKKLSRRNLKKKKRLFKGLEFKDGKLVIQY